MRAFMCSLPGGWTAWSKRPSLRRDCETVNTGYTRARSSSEDSRDDGPRVKGESIQSSWSVNDRAHILRDMRLYYKEQPRQRRLYFISAIYS